MILCVTLSNNGSLAKHVVKTTVTTKGLKIKHLNYL